jgi:hypothetical protein
MPLGNCLLWVKTNVTRGYIKMKIFFASCLIIFLMSGCATTNPKPAVVNSQGQIVLDAPANKYPFANTHKRNSANTTAAKMISPIIAR